jgi:uncharacterized phage protein gp47/JayE
MAISSTGLDVQSYEEILDSIIVSEQTNISDTIDVDEDTALGQLNIIMAAELALVNEGIQDVYDQRDILKAEGKALDDNVSWLGITRQAAAATAGTQHFTGKDGTILASGSYVQNSATGQNYTLDSALTLSKSACRDLTFSILAVVDSTIYTVTVQGVAHTFTSGVSATAQEIITGLVAVITGANYTSVDNANLTATVSVTDATDLNITVDTNIKVTQVTSVGYITGFVKGSLSAPANTVNLILSPTSGWVSTNNETALIIGRQEETDAELRQRAIAFRSNTGKATVDSIISSLLDVSGVSSVAVNQQFVSDGSEPSVVTIDTVVDSTVYTITIQDVAYTYTSGIGATANDITAGLALAINTSAQSVLGLSAVDNVDTTITINPSPLWYKMQVAIDANMSLLAGQPSGSIQIVVAGGLDDDEIAQNIWDTKPCGVEVWAVDDITKQSGTAVDIVGDTHIIEFNRPTSLAMVVTVTYKVFDASVYPSDDNDAYDTIKDTIVLIGNLLNAGEDVVPNEFLGAVYCSVGGLYSLEIVINGQSSDDPLNVVTVASTEEAFFSVDQITVVNNT